MDEEAPWASLQRPGTTLRTNDASVLPGFGSGRVPMSRTAKVRLAA